MSEIEAAGDLDLSAFDKIVPGAVIHYGWHCRLVYDFVRRNAQRLDEKPNALFPMKTGRAQAREANAGDQSLPGNFSLCLH